MNIKSAAKSEAPREPDIRVIWTDPETGTHGFLVIDRLIRGTAGGGTRIRKGCTLEEVERLARTMSHKKAILQLPGGGAKAGIDWDPRVEGGLAVLSRFMRTMAPFLESNWVTGEDMGVTQEQLNQVFSDLGINPLKALMRHGKGGDSDSARERVRTGLAQKDRGVGLADCIGGYGVAMATACAMEHLKISLSQARAVVQGFGAMGGASARYLKESGVKVVGLADVNGAYHCPSGFDVEELIATRSELGEIDQSRFGSDVKILDREEWLGIDAEILVPAAQGDAITAKNVGKIGANAKVVAEAANFPTDRVAQEVLHQRGVLVVPDFVANAGANWWWWSMMLGTLEPTLEAAFKGCRAMIRDSLLQILRTINSQVMPMNAAVSVAESNLTSLVKRYGVYS